MRPINWKQFRILYDTQANIEARTDVSAWSIAIATDRSSSQKFGYFNGTTWEWVGGGGGGGVESVTGDLVDNTDPANPVVNLIVPTTTTLGGVKRNTGSAGQYVTGIDTSGNLEYDTPAGTGVESVTGDGVNNTDPLNPVISYPTPGDIGAEPALGYTPENVANKSTDVDADKTSNTKYPSVKAVYDWAVGLFVQKNAGIAGATKTKITYDAKGLVTSGADATAADVGAVALSGSETVNGVKTFSSDPIIPDEAYGVGWNGSLEPPTKNAVYDKIESIRFSLPFSSYANLGSPISASPAFPYAATLPSYTIYPKQWSQGVVTGATNNGSNYWKLELLYTNAGVATVAATVTTASLGTNTTAVLTTTTFDLSSYTQGSNIRFAVRATKVGAPSDLNAHGPNVEYTTS